MNNQLLIKLTIKAFVVWLALSAAGFFYGEAIINTLTPYYKFVIHNINPDYQANIRINNKGVEKSIILEATSLKAIPITPDISLPAGKTIESSVTIFHTLVPLVILLNILLVFPMENIKQRLFVLALSIPAVLCVSALTAPLQLLGNLEIGFLNAAKSVGVVRSPSWVYEWMLLTEGGGRWLLPLLLGIGCCALARKLFVR